MQDSGTRYGRKEYDGAAGLLGDHMVGTGLGDEEGTCKINVDEMAEHCVIVVFGFDV